MFSGECGGEHRLSLRVTAPKTLSDGARSSSVVNCISSRGHSASTCCCDGVIYSW